MLQEVTFGFDSRVSSSPGGKWLETVADLEDAGTGIGGKAGPRRHEGSGQRQGGGHDLRVLDFIQSAM